MNKIALEIKSNEMQAVLDAVMTSKFGNLAFIARSEVAIIPSSLSASEPILSFSEGIPKSKILSKPSAKNSPGKPAPEPMSHAIRG